MEPVLGFTLHQLAEEASREIRMRRAVYGDRSGTITDPRHLQQFLKMQAIECLLYRLAEEDRQPDIFEQPELEEPPFAFHDDGTPIPPRSTLGGQHSLATEPGP